MFLAASMKPIYLESRAFENNLENQLLRTIPWAMENRIVYAMAYGLLPPHVIGTATSVIEISSWSTNVSENTAPHDPVVIERILIHISPQSKKIQIVKISFIDENRKCLG